MDFSSKAVLHNSNQFAFNAVDCSKVSVSPVIVNDNYETTSQAIARILLGSGAVTRDQYDVMIGLHYDSVVEEDSEDFSDDRFATTDDHFEQSSFASYEPEPSSSSSESPGVVETPKITSSEQIVANSDVPASAESGSLQESAEPKAQ